MAQRAGRSSGDAAGAVGAVPGRRGTCRLCFDGDGDLVAPCLCRGTSKWIHRECLDQWRANGSNPRALTNCCECGFQYRLRLQRNEALSSEGEQRRRQLMRRFASQTLLGFVGLQLVICALSCIIRAIDRREVLVQFFGFSQVSGHEGPGTFVEALKFHKETYYLSGILALLAIVGVVVSLGLCCICCGRETARSRIDTCDLACDLGCLCCCPSHRYGVYGGEFYWRARACEDCATCCVSCCQNCGRHSCSCDRCPDVGRNIDCKKDGIAVVLAVLAIAVAVAFIFIGLFAAIMALVTAIQKAGQEFAKVQQLRVMATEYVVQDLADPTDLGDGGSPEAPVASQGGAAAGQQVMAPSSPQLAVSAPPPTAEDATVNAQVERELSEMFGSGFSPNPGQQALRGYGSV